LPNATRDGARALRRMGAQAVLAVDIFRSEDGKLAEHCDVPRQEVRTTSTKSGRPMSTGN